MTKCPVPDSLSGAGPFCVSAPEEHAGGRVALLGAAFQFVHERENAHVTQSGGSGVIAVGKALAVFDDEFGGGGSAHLVIPLADTRLPSSPLS